eukprot:3794982-Pyramimonas_sp.AAC.1
MIAPDRHPLRIITHEIIVTLDQSGESGLVISALTRLKSFKTIQKPNSKVKLNLRLETICQDNTGVVAARSTRRQVLCCGCAAALSGLVSVAQPGAYLLGYRTLVVRRIAVSIGVALSHEAIWHVHMM